MAWNEPGGNDKDPWGGNGGGRKGGDGPPDLDEALRKLQDKLGGLLGRGGPNRPTSGPSISSGLLVLLIVAAVVVYGLFGIYQVNEQERAVVLRLGVFSEVKGPGLRWNAPMIDKVTKVNVSKVRSRTTRGKMLTQDLNIVDVSLSVQYQIIDVKNFVLNVRDPEGSLIQATDSALRHVVGSSPMHEVLTEGREQMAVDVDERLQTYLDSYQTGINVTKVSVEDTSPPQEVQAAFDDVNKAREDEERVKNEAETYANGILPEARGAAQRVIEEATAYREQVVAKAEGEAQRFEQLLGEYKKAPKVTRERMYLDTVQDVMANSSKVLVDVEGGNNMLYLPLDKIVSGSSLPSGSTKVSPQLINDIANQVEDQLRRQSTSSSIRGVR